MNKIETGISTGDGIVDCMIELIEGNESRRYSITLLYPYVVNGFSRSEVYCHEMFYDASTQSFYFDSEDIHPKVKRLEAAISSIITSNSTGN